MSVKMPVAMICGAVFRGSEFKGLGIKGFAPNSKLFAVLGNLEWLVSTSYFASEFLVWFSVFVRKGRT